MRATDVLNVLTGWFRASEPFRLARAYVLGAAPESAAALRAVAALAGGERRRVERLALRAQTPRALAALGHLGGPRARARLELVFARERARLAQAPGGPGALMIAAAAALWREAPDDAFVAAIVARLRAAPSRGERMWAADALGAMPTRESEAALDAALADVDPLVRHVAARALLAVHGLAVEPQAAEALERQLRARLQEAPGASM